MSLFFSRRFAFAGAHRVIHRRYVITRLQAQFMEPRGALGVYDPGEDRYTLYVAEQWGTSLIGSLETWPRRRGR